MYMYTHTYTHRHEGIALPLLRMRARGNKIDKGTHCTAAPKEGVELLGQRVRRARY